MHIRFDYASTRTMQPTNTFSPDISAALSLYGTATYGNSVYSGGERFVDLINVEGSGFSNDFKFTSDGTGDSFKLDSLYIDARAGAKQ